MSDKIKSVLAFLRITDETGNLSLTNLALVVSTVAMMLRPEVAVTDAATFVATVIGYQFKRYVGGNAPVNESEALTKAIAALETKVTAMQMANQLRR
jgi:hypothetical protein